MLPLERKGFPEECYFTFSYSPIRDEAGKVGGVFCSVVETTAQLLAARRTRTLRKLAEIASVGRTEASALALAMDTLRESTADVAWAMYQPAGEAARTSKPRWGSSRWRSMPSRPSSLGARTASASAGGPEELPSSASDGAARAAGSFRSARAAPG